MNLLGLDLIQLNQIIIIKSYFSGALVQVVLGRSL